MEILFLFCVCFFFLVFVLLFFVFLFIVYFCIESPVHLMTLLCLVLFLLPQHFKFNHCYSGFLFLFEKQQPKKKFTAQTIPTSFIFLRIFFLFLRKMLVFQPNEWCNFLIMWHPVSVSNSKKKTKKLKKSFVKCSKNFQK